jgi:hypothetical protein
MAKKKRNHNPNLIKARHSYTFTEITETLNIHPRTVQSWHKQGLKVIEEASKPYLVYGEELRQFLKTKRQKQSHPLKTGEFYCTKCKEPRKSLPNKLRVEFTGRNLGKRHKQALIRGICTTCNQPLLLFSSDRKVKELEGNGALLQEHKTVLYGNRESSINTDIERKEECLN